MAKAEIGVGNVALLGNKTPYERRRDAHSADVQRRRLHHLHAHLASEPDVFLEAFRTVMAETIVISRHEQAHTKAVVQHVLHEKACRKGSHGSVEVERLHTVSVRSGKQTELLVEGCDEARHVVGLYHLPRMTVKGDDHRLPSACMRHLSKLADKKLMAAMYAVEEADGGTIAMIVRCRGYVCGDSVVHTCMQK